MANVDYKKLRIFTQGHQFTLDVYKITKKYPKEEIYGLVSQFRRSSSSICANISEGSAKSQKDFKRFLQIALGSSRECEYWLLLSKDLEYISIDTYDRLTKILDGIIGGLINYMKKIN